MPDLRRQLNSPCMQTSCWALSRSFLLHPKVAFTSVLLNLSVLPSWQSQPMLHLCQPY